MDQSYQNQQGAARNYIGAVGETAATPKQQPEGEHIVQTLWERADTLASLTARVRNFADRLNGGVPTPIGRGAGATDAPSPGLPPLNSRLRGASESLCEGLQALQEEIHRLESFI